MALIINPRVTTADAVKHALTGSKSDVRGTAFMLALLSCLLLSLVVLVTLLWSVGRGFPGLPKRGVSFLTGKLGSNPDVVGVSQGLWGSLVIAAFVVIMSFPVGIAAGVYLEEYAKPNRLTGSFRSAFATLPVCPAWSMAFSVWSFSSRASSG